MRIEDDRPASLLERTLGLVQLLHRLWTYSTTTRSDLARDYADEIAEAAGRGFITTAITPGGAVYGRLWKLTPAGTLFLYDNAGSLVDQEAAYVERHTS